MFPDPPGRRPSALIKRLREWSLDRRAHVLIACLVAGLASSAARPPAAVAIVGALALASLLVAQSIRGAALALVLVGALVGAMRIAAIDRPARSAAVGSVLDADATLLEKPRLGQFGMAAAMRVESGPAAGLRIMARRRESFWPQGQAGARFHIRAYVKPPRPRAGPATRLLYGIRLSESNAGRPGTPGFGPLPPKPDAASDFDYAGFLRSRGIGREVKVESLVFTGRRGGLAGVVDAIRMRAERGISAHLRSDRAALARGMVLGEDGDISQDVRDDFRRAGLAHLLAASGQNVALLCTLVLPLLILAGTGARARVVVLLPLVGLYVALAGGGASVARAGVMAAAALVAARAGRPASATYALLLAAAVTLGLNPRSLADPGWQLSFAAVTGMLVLGPLAQERLRWLPRAVAEAIAVSCAATVATAPLLAHDFGAVSIAALPANIAALPAVAPVMWIGMAEAAFEQLGAIAPPLAGIVRGLDAVAAPISALALDWIRAVASRFADLGWAQAQLRIGWAAVALAYTALALGLVVLRNEGVRRVIASARPASERAAGAVDWLRSLRPTTRRALAAPVAALALGALARAAEPPRPPPHFTIDFLDVGQGDSTLIRDRTGAAILFDGGVPEARVDRTLRRLGVRRLSAVVATHQSRDHHGGLLEVVRRFPVGLFLDGRYGVQDPSFIALEREVDRRHIPRRPTQQGEHLRVGAMTVDILWPPPRGNAPPPADPNTRATVAIVREAGFSLLLSADAEAPVLLPLDLPRVDAMKVPHHGSAEEGLPRLLQRLNPTVAAIECGRGNPFAHPRPSTLDALRRVPRVYRTDRDGTIELAVIGRRLEIRTHR